MKRIQTVKGDIPPHQLGKTMVHEHTLWEFGQFFYQEPEELTLRELYNQKVGLENRGRLLYHFHKNLDNMVQRDLSLAIEEMNQYKMAGGGTIVDVTPIGIGRDPMAMAAVSNMTGLNIIMGTGFYTANAHPTYIKEMNENQVAEIMIKDLTEGVKETGIKAGIIGEIGFSSSDFNPEEMKVMMAAIIAQKETGACISIHPPQKRLELLDIIEKNGGMMDKIIIGHINPTRDTEDYLDAIAKRGAYIAYDQFGYEIPLPDMSFVSRDIDRIMSIKVQIERGNLDRILVSQDIGFKMALTKFGGWGYAHILRDLVPYMKKAGITDGELSSILVDNPARILSF